MSQGPYAHNTCRQPRVGSPLGPCFRRRDRPAETGSLRSRHVRSRNLKAAPNTTKASSVPPDIACSDLMHCEFLSAVDVGTRLWMSLRSISHTHHPPTHSRTPMLHRSGSPPGAVRCLSRSPTIAKTLCLAVPTSLPSAFSCASRGSPCGLAVQARESPATHQSRGPLKEY